MVGAWRYGASNDKVGRAYVFFGGSPMNTVPDLILNGEALTIASDAQWTGLGM